MSTRFPPGRSARPLIAWILLCQCASGPGGSAREIRPTDASTGYRTWRRVNETLVPPTHAAALRCYGYNTPGRRDQIAFHVYVNKTGESAMLTQARPRFPAGTVLIKECYLAPDLTHPKYLAAMRKRDDGGNSQNGDWEFLIREYRGGVLSSPPESSPCARCHSLAKATDQVFRSYLSPAQRKELR